VFSKEQDLRGSPEELQDVLSYGEHVQKWRWMQQNEPRASFQPQQSKSCLLYTSPGSQEGPLVNGPRRGGCDDVVVFIQGCQQMLEVLLA